MSKFKLDSDKILLSTDWHFNKSFGKFDETILQGVRELCAYAVANNLKYFIQLGDVIDVKQHILHSSLTLAVEAFELISNTFEHSFVLVGNHDIFKKVGMHEHNISFINAFPNITLVDAPITIETKSNKQILMLPFVGNTELLKEFLVPADYLFGHLEINGYLLNSFVQATDGLDSDNGILDKYELVVSGHFHKRQHRNNICYIGSMMRFFYGEQDEARGYSVFNAKTADVSYIDYSHPSLFKIRLSKIDEFYSRLKEGDKIKLVLDSPIQYHELEQLKISLKVDHGITELVIEEDFFAFDVSDLDDEEDDEDSSDEELTTDATDEEENIGYFDFILKEVVKKYQYSDEIEKFLKTKIKEG